MDKQLKIGNVLWLRLRPSIEEDFMEIAHPYLIININKFVVEVLQLNTYDACRNYRAIRRESVIIPFREPLETVIYKDCYAHLEKLITINNFNGLANYRKTEDVLSNGKLEHIKSSKDRYLKKHPVIKDKFIMSFTKEEILEYND